MELASTGSKGYRPLSESDRLKLGPAVKGARGRQLPSVKVAYRTNRGFMVRGFAENALLSELLRPYRGKVQLILTSPPFPLNRKKKYGNFVGEEYIEWLSELAPVFREFLKPDGSIVIELGNAWEPGHPVMSPLALKALLAFLEKGNLYLAEQFVCYNRARLPSPAQWVNVKRIRVKDSYTHVWWMSPSYYPQADNTRVLKPYSDSMLKLLETKRYNAGRRPSEHHIGKTSFFKDNRGAIPSNVLEFTNTTASDDYLEYCRARELELHPARMPIGLADFFIKFLTKPKNLVLDPFAGSNTTGAAAERLKRRWISIEPTSEYIRGSRGRLSGAIRETAAGNGRARSP